MIHPMTCNSQKLERVFVLFDPWFLLKSGSVRQSVTGLEEIWPAQDNKRWEYNQSKWVNSAIDQ